MNAYTSIKAWNAMDRTERVEAIRPLWIAGHSARDIGTMLGARTKNVIIGMIARHIGRVERERVPAKARRYSPQPRAPKPRPARMVPRTRKSARIPVPALKPLPSPPAAGSQTLCPPPATGSVAFLDRHIGQCAWIYGEASSTALVCGEPIIEGKPYCQAHCHIAYIPAKSDGRLRNNHYRLKAR